jgi:ankyrin repeat protein
MTSVHSNSLSKAIESNDIALVATLIAGGSVNVNARVGDEHGSSVLWRAAQQGRVEIVELLLGAGARIDDANDLQETACHGCYARPCASGRAAHRSARQSDTAQQ